MNNKYVRAAAVSLVAALCMLSAVQPAHADIEWTEKKQLNVGASPVDLVTSPDGKWVFILTSGELLAYSVPEDKIVDRTPVDKAFDKIAYSMADGSLLVSSSTGSTIKIIQMAVVNKFSLAGIPFKGPENAAVTIVVFSDYQ
jgi:protein-disulfide isomerase